MLLALHPDVALLRTPHRSRIFSVGLQDRRNRLSADLVGLFQQD